MGLGISIFHFIIVNILSTETFLSIKHALWVLLATPGFPLVLFFPDFSIIGYLISSIFYGCLAGLLVSNKTNLRLVGIVLLSLLIYAFSFWISMFGAIFA